jgi:hypothetical protein
MRLYFGLKKQQKMWAVCFIVSLILHLVFVLNLEGQKLPVNTKRQLINSLIQESNNTNSDTLKIALYMRIGNEFSQRQIDSNIYYLVNIHPL